MAIQTFRAGPDGVIWQKEIANAVYTKVIARTDFDFAGVQGFDSGGEWDNDKAQWQPQAGPIEWTAQVWAMGFGEPQNTNFNLVLTCFKNGVDFHAAIGGAQVSTFPETGSAICCGMDIANGNDVYDFRVYMTTADGKASGWLNADPRHIWLCGRSFGT
jgi:hypothetical protein